MTQIKVLDLDNDCSLSELSREDINIVRGGYLTVFRFTRKNSAAIRAYHRVLADTKGNYVAAWAASLSTST